MQSLKVNLGERSYPIYVGAGILERAGELLTRAGLRGKVAIVTNPVVAQLYLDTAHDALNRAGFDVTPVLIPDGEEHKNLQSLASIYDGLIAARLERKSCVFALGGGVIGDLAGLAAATYLRGVPYVQVPTTLLAQVDSSVGGKTGVNHADGKNLIGAFYQPKLVLIDVAVLRSLPKRELVAGLAEVIKYGIIEDPALFSLLEQGVEKIIGLQREMLTRVIATSCAIKARVVEADEREDDYRAVLNFGHTVGHALEAATGYRQLLHGEAVGVGMVKAAALSASQGFCDDTTIKRITALIQRAGLPSDMPWKSTKKLPAEKLNSSCASASVRLAFTGWRLMRFCKDWADRGRGLPRPTRKLLWQKKSWC
jgi:3-dehydroquinate synthase